MKSIIKKWSALLLLPLFVLSSCDKYLDVQPKGKRLLKSIGDFNLWLDNTTALAYAIPNEINMLDDRLDLATIKTPPSGTSDLIYVWAQQYAAETFTAPVIWKDFYETIYYFNTVILEIDGAVGGSEEQKKSLKAEALLGRAFSYLYLVNLYGKPYNPATAGQDLAVPFVTSNDLNTPTPDRSTVKEIYDHIIADIEAALPALPKNNNPNRFRGSIAAGYSILARTYLYMGDYPKAAANAQLALDNGQNTGLDYSVMPSASGISNLVNRPGAIYGRLLKTTYTTYTPTLSFMKTFNTKDLRLAYYYLYTTDYSFTKRGEPMHFAMGINYSNAFPNCGTTVEEMRLIMAESAARGGDLPKAIEELHQVRKTRFKPADYQKFESADKELVLQKVLTERSLEFAFNAMRWFDMRRLDAEGRMPAVNRYDGQNNLIATLPPRSNKYTLQIPMQVMYFNPGWTQNAWD
ncbi:RagB/SusD family nutrient uptake outer membrane protein [Pedobacter faecalis]|uniref:RagB/SusD family nutrient uptake outer membrane protein n=1 Tax=Pedobacter faecalis TaxID=3041495 RepID=UPI00254B4671|nr:RagB/SusD family nutrient uptake outer membrane protein [Pedobacter sp. ELA7]